MLAGFGRWSGPLHRELQAAVVVTDVEVALGELHDPAVLGVLLLVLAVLPHVVGWLFQAIRHGRLPPLGPVGRAWKDAQAVTPMIFRG